MAVLVTLRVSYTYYYRISVCKLDIINSSLVSMSLNMSSLKFSQSSILQISAGVTVFLSILFLRRHRRVQRSISNIAGPESNSWAGRPIFHII